MLDFIYRFAAIGDCIKSIAARMAHHGSIVRMIGFKNNVNPVENLKRPLVIVNGERDTFVAKRHTVGIHFEVLIKFG